MERDDEVRPGWLPPKPPVPGAWEPPRTAYGVSRRDMPSMRPPPSTPARVSIVLGAISLILLVFSVGYSYAYSALLSAIALVLGKRADRRPAVVLAVIGLVFSVAGAAIWISLEASGYSYDEFIQSLRDYVERQRESAGARSS